MAVHNIVVPVLARLEAKDGAEATRNLIKALTDAGFYVYEEGINPSDAFLDEDQQAAETLPQHTGYCDQRNLFPARQDNPNA